MPFGVGKRKKGKELDNYEIRGIVKHLLNIV